MKRSLRVLVMTCAMLLAFAVPASAHVLLVSPKGGQATQERWIGTGQAWETRAPDVVKDPMQSLYRSHSTGTYHACIATTGHEVVFIGAPWNDLNHCKHSGS
jgi:hypothetical protein